MNSKNGVGFLVIMIVLTQFAPSANALPTGVLDGWFGNVGFNCSGLDGRTLIGQIDYAVYDVDDYPGSAPSGGQYIYAYQISNFNSSDVGVDSFSVGILEGADVGDIYWDDYQVTDGIKPFLAYFSPDSEAAQSAVYLFLPGLYGLVESGQHSLNLLFSSDNGPTMGFGIIGGGSIGEMVSGLPTPIPEPATIALLGTGVLMALSRKRRFA